jgi:hypothetical protein
MKAMKHCASWEASSSWTGHEIDHFSIIRKNVQIIKLKVRNTYRWSFLSVRYIKMHAHTMSTVLQAAHCHWRCSHNLWIVLLTVPKFLFPLLSVSGLNGLRAAVIWVDATKVMLCTLYYCTHCDTVHAVGTVHNLNILYTVHTVHTLHSVHTVHTVILYILYTL